MKVEQILQMRNEGQTVTAIAKILNLTVNQVRYQIRKQQLAQSSSDSSLFEETLAEIACAEEENTTEQEKIPSKANPPELPDQYHQDLCQLLVKDSTSIFAYWEVSNRKRWLYAKNFNCDWSEFPLVLRVYDVTDQFFNGSNANRFFDIEVGHAHTDWMIRSLAPSRTYIVDVGIREISGRFLPVLRSNPVQTPRNREAVYGDAWIKTPNLSDGFSRIPPNWFENFSAYKVYE